MNFPKLETRKIADLKLWDKNPRSIKDDRFSELKKSIEELGFNDVLKITEDGTVIGGNMRLRALQELGFTDVPVIVTDAKTDAEVLRVALRDNEEFGYYEEQQVAELALAYLDPLELSSFELHLGKPTSLNLLMDKFGPEPVEDESPEVDETNVISKLGEVYQLGSHRVMCGDSTDKEQIAELMNGVRADLLLTDPPYNLGFSYNEYVDNKSLSEYEELLLKAIYDVNIGNKIVTTGKQNLGLAYKLADVTDVAIWYSKNKMSGGKISNLSLWEPIVFIGKFDRKTRANDVLEYTNENQKDTGNHSCPKTVKLFAELLKYANINTNILDTFLGSGTTLIACEQTGRICYGMELDPKYVDVIRKRYAKFIEPETWEEQWQNLTPVAQQS